jgi:hypothetical protein
MEPGAFEHTSAATLTNTKQTARGDRKTDAGNRNTPEEAFFIKIRFEFLIDRSLDIEEDEGTSDIEEKAPHREVLSGTNPVRRRPHG